MIKVFLSHSSKQKTFVTELADLIGRDMTIVDQFEFEANRKIKNVINDYFLLFAGHRLN